MPFRANELPQEQISGLLRHRTHSLIEDNRTSPSRLSESSAEWFAAFTRLGYKRRTEEASHATTHDRH